MEEIIFLFAYYHFLPTNTAIFEIHWKKKKRFTYLFYLLVYFYFHVGSDILGEDNFLKSTTKSLVSGSNPGKINIRNYLHKVIGKRTDN